jgi:hypothetical protein
MPPEVSRTNAAIAFTAFALMALGCFVPFIWKVVVPFAATGHAPADWTWPRVSIALCVLLALFFYLGYGVFQRFGTRLTEAEIAVPTLRGCRCLRWEQIERIGTRGHELLFQGASGTITVNLLCFKRPSEVEEFVRSHLPARLGGSASAA